MWHRHVAVWLGAAALIGSPAASRATLVDLTSGTPGVVKAGQSFNNETRGIDVTVLGGSDLVVTSMTLSEFDTQMNPTTVGARVFTSAGSLLASATTSLSAGNDHTVTLAITAALTAGQSYRFAFYNGSGDADIFDPDATPYTEASGTFQVNGAFRSSGDAFPSSVNVFFPMVEVEVAVAGPGGCVVDPFNLASVGFSAVDASQASGQSFCVGTTGQLAGIEVAPRLGNANTGDTVFIEIFDAQQQSLGMTSMSTASFPPGVATVPDPLVLGSEGPGYFDLTSLGISVSADECLSYELTKPVGNNVNVGLSSNLYPDGELLINGSANPVLDATFKVCVVPGEPPPPLVPSLSPLALAALATTLLFLGRLRLAGVTKARG